MPAEIPGTWKVLDRAVGVKRRVVARAIGRPLATYEKHLLPPPSDEFPQGNGVTNELDLVCTTIDKAEHPFEILEFINARYGYEAVRKGSVQGRLFVRPGDVEELAADLAKELRRREPKAERLRELRDTLADACHRLVEEKEARETRERTRT